MKKLIRLLILSCILLTTAAAGEESSKLLRDGLFAEEAQQDNKTAIEKYQTLLSCFNKERKIAVTALYRLAEIHRKQGDKKEAAALYRRILTEFPSMETQVRMSKENLVALGEKLPEGRPIPLDEESKELARIKKLLSTSPDAFKEPSNLVNAADENWLRVLAYLIKQGVDVNQGDALDKAASEGHLAACKLLLDNGCDPNQDDNSGALRSAFTRGNFEIMQLLIKEGANVKGDKGQWLVSAIDDETPLSHIKLIIEAGCSVNVISNDLNIMGISGGGILHQALIIKNKELIDYLIEKKADINLAYKDSCITPLHLAVWIEDEKNVNRLIRAGANINARCVKLPNTSIISKFTPLSLAIAKNNLTLAKILLKAKAELPAHCLKNPAREGKTEWVKFFLDHGADPNPSDPLESSDALIMAIRFQHEQITHLLLAKGASLQQHHLHYASASMRTEWMRKNRYPEFATRKGITLVIPESPWDTEFMKTGGDSSKVAFELFNSSIPKKLKVPQKKQGNHVSGATDTIYLREMDHVKCILFRQGKQLPFDLNADTLPSLQAGDILEWTEFKTIDEKAAKIYRRRYSEDRSTSQIQLSRCGLMPSIRKHIRIPIQMDINGDKKELLLHGGLAVFDPRNQQLPLCHLHNVLMLMGVDTQHKDTNIIVHRKNWPPFPFSLATSFTLQSGDDIKVTTPIFTPKSGKTANITVVTPGLPYYRTIPSSATPPTLLQVLTECYNAINLTKINTYSSTPNSLWVKELQQPEKLGSHLIRTEILFRRSFITPSSRITSNLYHIDFSNIKIRRINQTAVGENQEISIHIDLEKAIREWDSSRKSAKQNDPILQPGDLIELQLKKGVWLDFTASEKKFIEAALSYEIMISGAPQGIAPKRIQYKLPRWIQTQAGLIPIHPDDDMVSPLGSAWIKGAWLHVRRANQYLQLSPSSYWPRDGDQISVHQRRPTRSVPKK